MANEFIARNGLIAQNNSTVTGSLDVTGSLGVTGSFSTQTFDGLTYVPAISISNFSRTIYDVMGTSSFDADARDLYDSTTVNSISWESRRLTDGLGSASINWDTRWLVDPLGITTVRWGIRTGYDSSTSQSIDWGGRILYDANESYSIDWAAKALWGTGGFPTLEWASRYLNDASGNISVDWGNRLTKDSSNKESIDYQNRQLKNSNGNEVLNWQSGVTITGSAIVSGSLESTGSFSVQTYNSFLAATATAIELNDTTRRIYDTSGLLSIDALFRTANYQNLSPSIDWQNSFLYDSLGNTSLNWGTRSLLDSSNTVVFNWDAFALNYKIETNTYLKRFIEVGTQDLFSDVGVVGFNYEGEVIEATLDGTVNQFDLVYLETDGKWYPVAQGTADCTKLLGICAETGARPKVILEGSITVNDGTYIDTPIVQGINFGLPIYVRESAGNTMSTVVPTTAGQYVRILGHAYYQNTGSPEYWTIKFRPSNEWIEL